jgi:cytochrome c oxidase subunit 1
MYPEWIAKFAAFTVFMGFNLTFFPQFVMGARGMPRRYASYPVKFVDEHRLSTCGAYTLGFGLSLAALDWALALKRGKRASDNPWGANTLEWRSSSPPPHDNFAVTPIAGDPYDLHGWVYDPAIDGWVNPDLGKRAGDTVPTRTGAHHTH